MKDGCRNKLSLILVDDESGFRRAIARRLEKRGFDLMEASGGEVCLDLMELWPETVVVMDVKMPGMSGMATLKMIKQHYPKTQVILLTGNASVGDGIEGIKSGAFDYLTKPVELDHLINKINQAFEIIQREKEKVLELEYRTKLEKKMVDTERLVSLGTMSTGIAHEINNPLAIINESAGFMKQVMAAPEMLTIPKRDAILKGIEKIEKSVKRARKITHQLLGHVKKPESVYSEIDVVQLIDETLGLLDKEIKEKKIQIVWETGRTPSHFRSDPYQVRQVLINLLDNAVHALKKNGSIRLYISETRDDMVLEIKDDGIGIPQDKLGLIFDPFFTSKPFDEGTGLGLFVVHKILSRLDAKIDVESDVGKGSCFKISFPKAGPRENNVNSHNKGY